MRARKHVLVFLLPFVLVSCTPWRAEYLEDVKGKANQDAVVMRLGPPTNEKILSTGDAVWIYRYTGAALGESRGGTWCKEYL